MNHIGGTSNGRNPIAPTIANQDGISHPTHAGSVQKKVVTVSDKASAIHGLVNQRAAGLTDVNKQALYEKLLGDDSVSERNKVIASTDPLTPEHANSLLNEVTIARQFIAALNQPTADGVVRQMPPDAGGNTARQVDRLSPQDRSLVVNLQKLIDTNLQRLNHAADANIKLKENQLFQDLSKTTADSISQKFKTTFGEQMNLGFPDSFRGSIWRRKLSGDDAKTAMQQIVNSASVVIRQNPDMRLAIDSNLAFEKKPNQTGEQARAAYLNEFVSDINLNANDKLKLVGALNDLFDSGKIKMLGSDPDPSNVKPGENNPFVLDVRIGGGGNGDVFSLKQPVRLAADGPIVYPPTGLVAKEIRVFENRYEEMALQDEFRDGGKFDDAGYQKAYSKKVEESVLKTAIENAMQARIGDNNPHVPRLVGFTQVDGKAYVIMQEMGGGGVDKFAEKNAPFGDPALPPQERTLRLKGQLHVFSGMVRGVAAMHERGLVHCDIKPQNSMIDRETNEGMVIDLGNTVRVDSAIGLGTLNFMSPEQTRPQAPAHPSSDVWSLGATLYTQMGFTLFPNSRNITGSLRNGEDGTLGAPPHWTTPDPSLAPIKAFIMACFNRDPNLRPTAAQMVQALNDEPITTAPDGFGLPSGSTDLLDFLRPTSASMAGGRDAFAQLMDRP